MDGGTHARVEEEKALDSSRLRSSARLGFASSSSASTAAAAAAAGSSSSSSSRIARRKRKKRRRQRRSSNDEVVGVASSTVSSGDANATNATTARDSSAEATTVASADEDSTTATATATTTAYLDGIISSTDAPATASTTGSNAATASTTTGSGNKQSKNRLAAHTTNESQRTGGSGTRAAASSVSSGITLLNRRAGKRSSRRCNASGRRNAMTMDLQRLITEVHARPAIWDQKNVNYHNRDVILKMWREIARACEVSTDVAKSKWKHLRDNFRNELKKTYRGKCDGGANEHDSKWVWFRSLFFLRDQMNSRVIGCALSQNCSAALRSSPDGTQIEPQIDILEGHEETQFDDLDGDSCQSLLSNEDGLHQVMPPPKLNKMIGRKRTIADAMDNEYPEVDRKRFESLQKRLAVVQEEEDDTYHFLMSVRNPLRSLPLDRQMFVRLKIQELVYNEINSQNQQNQQSQQNQQNRSYDGSQDVKPPRAMHAGNGGVAGAAGCGDVVSDMSNPASLLQNCTPEGSSDDAFFG